MAYKSLKSVMYMKYGQKCMICGWKPKGHKKHKTASKHENYLTYHHMVEKSEGGPSTIENGAILCRFCHEWLHQQPKLVQIEVNEILRNYKKKFDA